MNDLVILGEDTHFDISDYFVISEFDIEKVDRSSISLIETSSR